MENVFLQILNNAITVSVLILVIMLVRILGRKMPKWITCLLWILVAAKLILPFPIESKFSLLPTGNPIPTHIAMENNSWSYAQAGNPGNENKTNVANSRDTAYRSGTLANLASGDSAYGRPKGANPLQIFIRVGTGVWIAGSIMMILYAAAAYVKVKRKVRISVKTGKNIYECDDIEDPFILGIIRPRIYLSSGMPEETKNYVLRHERAHLDRKDYLWKPLGFLILSVYWFQPLCWAAYILMSRDIEYACDEKAIRGEKESVRADYCRALLICSMPKKMIAACPVAFGENGVKGRVKNMMNYKKPTFWISGISVVIVLLVAVCFATSPHEKEDGSSTAENNTMESTTIGNNTQPETLTDTTSERIRWEAEMLTDNLAVTEKVTAVALKDKELEQIQEKLVWYDTFDFEGIEVEPCWYDFDGYTLYYAYDIINNEDTTAVTVDVEDATSEDFSQIYYKSGENKTEEGSRISMWVIIYLGEYRDTCDVTIRAKGEEPEYRLTLTRNQDKDYYGMVEKVEKVKRRAVSQ